MSEKDHTPNVSIILPTYNRAGLIMETIESILNQTYSNWELIIVDDGSDDNTEELINQTKDERIKLYKAGRIGLVGKIKNIGIEKANGELIAFIDSDDLWAETKLEKQINALQQYPDAGFSLTGGYNFKERNKPIEYFYKQKEGVRYDNTFIAFFKSEVSAAMPSLILRKQCLQTIGLFKESKPFSDVEFILSLAKHFKAVILFEPLFYRRIHDANDSDANWIKRHYEGIEMILSYKDSLPDNVVADALFRSKINFGEKCLKYKKKREAMSSFFSAWKQKPFSIIPLKKISKTIVYHLKGK
jgi:glycosyltransferase involved in cell wall biosynthesis